MYEFDDLDFSYLNIYGTRCFSSLSFDEQRRKYEKFYDYSCSFLTQCLFDRFHLKENSLHIGNISLDDFIQCRYPSYAPDSIKQKRRDCVGDISVCDIDIVPAGATTLCETYLKLCKHIINQQICNLKFSDICSSTLKMGKLNAKPDEHVIECVICRPDISNAQLVNFIFPCENAKKVIKSNVCKIANAVYGIGYDFVQANVVNDIIEVQPLKKYDICIIMLQLEVRYCDFNEV